MPKTSRYHYLGIDPSLTSTGLVALRADGTTAAVQVVRSKPSKEVSRLERYREILDEVIGWIVVHSPPQFHSNRVAIEGYSFGSRGRALLNLAELGGILRYALFIDHGLDHVEVPPKTLKLYTCGKGGGPGAGKPGMAVAAYRRWQISFDDDDLVDAYALAQLARTFWGEQPPETEYQRRAIDKLEPAP